MLSLFPSDEKKALGNNENVCWRFGGERGEGGFSLQYFFRYFWAPNFKSYALLAIEKIECFPDVTVWVPRVSMVKMHVSICPLSFCDILLVHPPARSCHDADEGG